MVNKKPFWQALVFTAFVFAIGLLIGFYVESLRQNNVESSLYNAETNILDEQIREKVVQSFNISCDVLINNTFEFADRIYYDALLLEKYDGVSQFKNNFWAMHRRYDLLRVLLWTEAISIKEVCPQRVHTLVYLYEYNSDDLGVKAMQISLSKQLMDLKNKYPYDIILIPIAVNTNVSSVNLVLEKQNVTRFPSILIDEEKRVEGIVSLEELESLVFG